MPRAPEFCDFRVSASQTARRPRPSGHNAVSFRCRGNRDPQGLRHAVTGVDWDSAGASQETEESPVVATNSTVKRSPVVREVAPNNATCAKPCSETHHAPGGRSVAWKSNRAAKSAIMSMMGLLGPRQRSRINPSPRGTQVRRSPSAAANYPSRPCRRVASVSQPCRLPLASHPRTHHRRGRVHRVPPLRAVPGRGSLGRLRG